MALECDVDTTRLTLQYNETWKDQDVLWAALRSHRSFKDQRLPPKSDPRAWRIALHNGFELDGEAVIFTATMHLSRSKVGPVMRLEMHPLKREQSSRLFRQFGPDRFLEVRIPAVDSWQSDEKDIEAIAARWLAAKGHWFADRSWAGFYVRDRPLKVETSVGQHGLETKTVFYDRVMLFAESGIDILQYDDEAFAIEAEQDRRKVACSRRFMLCWLLNLEFGKQNFSQPYLKLFHRLALGTLSPPPPVTHSYR